MVALQVESRQVASLTRRSMKTDADSTAERMGRSAPELKVADRALVAAMAAPSAAPAIATYLGELERRPRPVAEVERELIAAAQAGDAGARERLIEAFLPLIGGVARLYRQTPGVERTELIQEGVVGLLRALERYELDRGVPFWGYAAWWVRQAMQQLVAELTRPVVLSDRALRQLAQIKSFHHARVQSQGREPTLQELAAGTSLTLEQVTNLVAADQPARGLEEQRPGVDGDVGTFGDLVADPLAEDAYERVVADAEIDELRSLLAELSERENMVLRARYGLDGPPETLHQIAGRIGVSSERVRQIEQRALGKLRTAAGAH
jgi:RNA polymerase primary sigma factor